MTGIALSGDTARWDVSPDETHSLTSLTALVYAHTPMERERHPDIASGAFAFGAVVSGYLGGFHSIDGISGAILRWRPRSEGLADRLVGYSDRAAVAQSRALVSTSFEATSETWRGMPFAARRGSLLRPVVGWVYREFGPIVHGDLETTLRHRGVTYAVEPGTAVRSVAPGLVAFAAHVEGHGNVVILDHGDGYHTVYAGLHTLAVDPNSLVSERDTLGQTGPRAPGQGRRLHFQIRRFSDALDPAMWIGRPGNAPTASR